MVESDRLFLNLGYVPSKPYTSYNMNFFDRLHSKKRMNLMTQIVLLK